MAERRASLMTPRMENLLERVDSKFTLVTLAAMRAREINDYYNQLGEGLGKIVPPQVTSVSRKPLSISLEEIEVGKIEAVPLPEEIEVDEAAEAAALLAVEVAGGTEANEPARSRLATHGPAPFHVCTPGSPCRPRRLRGHRRLQGRRPVPEVGRRGRTRHARPHPGRAALRG